MILPQQRLENVVGSLESYLATNWGTTTPISFPGRPFNQQDFNEWIRADLLLPDAGTYHRQTGLAGILGKMDMPMYNINVFCKKAFIEEQGQTGRRYRYIRLRDMLIDLFKETKEIPLKDFLTAGNPQINTLVCYETQGKVMPEALGVYGCNVTVNLRWLNEWEEP